MAVTAETRTSLIGLSVVMLGSAPGTDLLNGWVNAINDGMSLEDIANNIASSDDFTTTYPTFLTNEEFATSFLNNLMGDEEVPAALVTLAVGLVTGLLNDGMSRGELSLAVVGAMYDIHAQGAAHAAYGDLGVVADGLFNKIEVAEHYTLNARLETPSSSVLDGVNSDMATVTAAIEAIDSHAEAGIQGQTYVLTTVRDDINGTSADDLIVAEPIAQVSNVFLETLNPFDDIDGAAGNDTLAIYGVDPLETLSLGAEQVRNVENVILSTVGAVDADMSSWEGLESVDLQRFGRGDDVSITVDGATVGTGMTYGGDVTIAGAGGDLSITASGTSNVNVGSGAHTESVTVTGGGNITIGKNANGGGQSETVSSVSVSRVAHNTGTSEEQASGEYVPLIDDNGFVVGQNGSTRISIAADGTTTDLVSVDDDGVTLTNATTGEPLTIAFAYDHDGDDTTGTVDVTATLKFNVESGGIVLGAITTDPLPEGVEADAVDGMAIPTGESVIPTPSIGKEEADPESVMVGGGPTLTINSDSIADLTLASTTATILVHNQSKTADDKNMPEDLAITLNKYGTSKVTGKLCVAGAGSAENIMLTVSGDSWVDLNSNVVKMLDIDAAAKLSLSVSKFNADGMPTGSSETLAGVTVSGEGAVSMNDLAGMKKLASIDASGSSGNNSFKSAAHLAALATVMGGSGNDTVSLVADEDGKLESISTGDGNDRVSIVDGDYREDGLMVDLGDGDDSFDGNAGNDMSRVDGGDGRDTLKLSSDGVTYENADDKSVSIYSNFEVLDVGGGSGEYDVGRLGVEAIEIGESTDGEVTLENVGAGTSVSVSSSRSGAGAATSTDAVVEYNLSDDVTGAGSILGGANNSILNVSIMAMGGKGDSKAAQTGEASLTLESNGNIRGLIVDSNADVHGTAAGKGTTSGHYDNTVTLTETSVEEVQITGNAHTSLTGSTVLEYVTAITSGGGVTIDATASAMEQTLIGSQADDVLMAGGFVQTLTDRNTLLGNGGDDMLTAGAGGGAMSGGAGEDMLTGAGGTDLFVYNSHSESQLSFKKGEDDDGNTTYTAEGYDTISGFTSTSDKLHLSKALHAIVTAGEVVSTDAISNGVKAATEWAGWMNVDTDGDPDTTGTGSTTSTTAIDGDTNLADLATSTSADGGATDLRSFIGNGKGLFLTSGTTSGGAFGTVPTTYKNSIAMINQTTAGDQGTWLLFDIDGDGDFSLADDMVIFLSGETGPVAFSAATNLMSA